MASIIREITIDVDPGIAWDALRDWGAVHERLVPGFLSDAKIDGRDRVVTFFNGSVVRELFVGVDDGARRLAWAVADGSLGLKHYNASAQVILDGATRTRFVWTVDLLPDDLAGPVSELMERGLATISSRLSASGEAWAIRWDTARMSPRHHNSLPTVSPTSVIIEFHEFDGRWFITGRWGQGSGTEVKRTVRNSALGKLLLDRVEAARQEWRWRSSRVLADDAELWAQFCAEEAGVPMDRYRPEKRIVILAGQVGITWHDARQAPPNWEHLPDRSPRRLGKALIKHMNSLELSSTMMEPPQPTVPEEPQP